MLSQNKEWTEKEEIELINNLRKKISLEDIALKHNRSINSIELKIQKIIYDNITFNGNDIKKISIAFNIPIEEVIKKYENYKNFIEKKEKNLNINDIEKKIEKLERENRLIKAILDNNDLNRKLNEEINNKRINKNIKNILRQLRKSS
jgi:hypothetical protein